MSTRFARSFVFFLAMLAWGCATNEIGEESPCEETADCANGKVCDPVQKVCVILALPNNANNQNNQNNQNNENNQNNLNNQNNQNNANNTMDMGRDMSEDMEADMDPVVCTPTCAANQACQNGTCVDACNPACQAPQICTVNGCALPTCAASGDGCDLNQRDQGNFWCVDNGNGGECRLKCDDPVSASTCPNGQYCLTLNAAANQFLCVDSQCDTQGDCANQTCISFDNNVGLCLPAGSVASGSSCDPDVANTCVSGNYCRENLNGSGTCSLVCDPWNGTACGGAQDCALFSNRSGLCTDQIDPTGTDPFDQCTTPGSWCSDGTQCFTLTAQVNACFKYCRGGENDCAGTMTATGIPGICNNYIFAGDRTVGLCDPECDPLDADPCGTGANCVNGLCRLVCTAATVNDDCCNGNANCPFQCVNNLCE